MPRLKRISQVPFGNRLSPPFGLCFDGIFAGEFRGIECIAWQQIDKRADNVCIEAEPRWKLPDDRAKLITQ